MILLKLELLAIQVMEILLDIEFTTIIIPLNSTNSKIFTIKSILIVFHKVLSISSKYNYQRRI